MMPLFFRHRNLACPRHKLIKILLRHPEPQNLLVAERFPRDVDFFELGVFGGLFVARFNRRLVASFHDLATERAQLHALRDEPAQRGRIERVVLGGHVDVRFSAGGF